MEWQNLKGKPDRTNPSWIFQEEPSENSTDNFSTYWHWLKGYPVQGKKRLGYAMLTLIFGIVGAYLFIRYVLYSIFAVLWFIVFLAFGLYEPQNQLLSRVLFVLCALPEVWLLARCVLPLICGTVLWIVNLTADFKRKR